MPAASPRTTLGSFELVGHATSRKVYVYWQQIGARQQNGPEFRYCAVRLAAGHSAPPDVTTDAYALFHNLSLDRHEFSVTACNSVGQSADAATLVVPRQKDGKGNLVTIRNFTLRSLLCSVIANV